MNEWASYQVEKAKVTTLKEWLDFRDKWFDIDSWPIKSPDVRVAENKIKSKLLTTLGSEWGSIELPYHLIPEAQYECNLTYLKVGHPLQFPHMYPVNGDYGWKKECGYCEIFTVVLSHDQCPHCRRELAFSYTGD